MGREVRMKAGLLRAEREGRKAGTAKWAVASLVFGAFTAIPIGASAAVVIFSRNTTSGSLVWQADGLTCRKL